MVTNWSSADENQLLQWRPHRCNHRSHHHRKHDPENPLFPTMGIHTSEKEGGPGEEQALASVLFFWRQLCDAMICDNYISLYQTYLWL